MNIIQAVVLGIIEGVTEFLPISSTAHLEIASKLLKLAQSDFLKSFEIIIQLGSILAIVVLYFRILRKNLEVWKRIVVAFIPTGIIGLLLYKVIKKYFLGNYSLLIWTLALGGIVLIIFELFHKEKAKIETSLQEIETMSYSTAFLIGIAQALAIIPGVSRSAATIVAGLALGIRRQAIVEFSFLLAVPTMLAATGYDFIKNAHSFSSSQFHILIIGFSTTFFAALLSVSFLLRFIQKRNFVPFGIYRVILAIVLIFIL